MQQLTALLWHLEKILLLLSMTSNIQLRYDLLNCLEMKKMSVFPNIRPRRTASTYITVNVYCICRGPDTGEVMVACDSCKKWMQSAKVVA